MFFRLAAKNVQRSVKDYLVYFLTLMFAICIFYMFNSVDAQLVMLNLEEKGTSASNSVVVLVNLLSFVIAIVLAFLIIYANGYIMKRRKRELGLYMTLGISNRTIAGMMAVETLLIGVIALAVGIAAGYFASQGMSVLTAKIFQVAITNYHFIFSEQALIKTCVYFAVIFVAVMFLNVVSVSRQSLSKLLAADKENQKVPTRRRWAAIAVTAAGVAVIILSYWFVFALGFGAFLGAVLPAIGINFAGTLIFLFGISGLMLSSHHKSPRYFKGLRMFTERQLASRVTTNAFSMAFICSMLFLTLVIVSSTASMNSLLNRETQGRLPYDASITTYTEDRTKNVPVKTAMEEVGISDALFETSYTFPFYETNVLQGEICTQMAGYTPEAWGRISGQPLDAIALSNYNQILAMQGKPQIELAGNAFAINSTLDAADEALQPYLSDPKPLLVAGEELQYSGLPLEDTTLWTSLSNNMPIVLVLPDAVVQKLGPPYLDVFVGNFAGDADVIGQLLDSKADAVADYQTSSPTGTTLRMALKKNVELDNRMMDAQMTFVGLYIGMVFLIAGAAILALQLLSGASDDKGRYELLRKLGTDKSMINSAIFGQVAVYFLLPLVIAAVHSIFGISYMIQGIGAVGLGDIASGAVMIAVLICAIYGLYFAVTYVTCRAIINAKETRRTE